MMLAPSALRSRLDRAGILASIGCAVHCLIAPFVILLAPTMGGWWASPQTHLLISLFVLPVATYTMWHGFRVHQRRMVFWLGFGSASLVLLGTLFPWLEPLFSAQPQPGHAALTPEACTDCCPTVVVDEALGTWSLNFPPASWLTMLGGVGLVTAHWGNLRCCKRCETNHTTVGPFCSKS